MGAAVAVSATAPSRLVALSPGDDIRDELTRDRLLDAVRYLPGLAVLDYERSWWDGQSWVPCLVVRGGRRMRRLRVVETSGECVVVPFSRRLAHRWLSARRRPRRVELTPGPPSLAPAEVRVDGWVDAVRCNSERCGSLLLLGYDGPCPLCGT